MEWEFFHRFEGGCGGRRWVRAGLPLNVNRLDFFLFRLDSVPIRLDYSSLRLVFDQ